MYMHIAIYFLSVGLMTVSEGLIGSGVKQWS